MPETVEMVTESFRCLGDFRTGNVDALAELQARIADDYEVLVVVGALDGQPCYLVGVGHAAVDDAGVAYGVGGRLRDSCRAADEQCKK